MRGLIASLYKRSAVREPPLSNALWLIVADRSGRRRSWETTEAWKMFNYHIDKGPQIVGKLRGNWKDTYRLVWAVRQKQTKKNCTRKVQIKISRLRTDCPFLFVWRGVWLGSSKSVPWWKQSTKKYPERIGVRGANCSCNVFGNKNNHFSSVVRTYGLVGWSQQW